MAALINSAYCGLHRVPMTGAETLQHGCRDPDKQKKWGNSVCRWYVGDDEDLEARELRWKWDRQQRKKEVHR